MRPVCDLSANIQVDAAKPKDYNTSTRRTMSEPTHRPPLKPDLLTTRQSLLKGQSNPLSQIRQSLEAAHAPACDHAFLKITSDEATQAAADPGLMLKPLAGLAVSIKDLFDVGGQVTTAGSTILADQPPAARDCPAVARLKAAGGIVIGRTNMVEFAFSGVGVNPHFGTPANAAATDVPRIPGGSSSGAAVSVATGAAWVGLGSDTGGSIRIPAALNGIVGFKNTARLVPTTGAIPLSTTLDTVCALTRSARDAALVHSILSSRVVVRSAAPVAAYRLAVVKRLMQDDLDPVVDAAFNRTLSQLRHAGARIDEIDLPELADLPSIQSTGGLSAAESHAWHRHLIQKDAAAYDPRVLVRIQRGASMTASDYIDLQRARADWISRTLTRLQAYDAILSPTVPIVAPPLSAVAPGAERDAEFFRINTLLLRNPSVVNMLDGCAISIPCHRDDEMPVGLMIWAGAMSDDTVLNIACQVETLLLKA